MGYSTQFTGRLNLVHPATPEQREALREMFGEDCRDHPEWEAPGLYYIDLQLTADGQGIQWDGAEKTYDLDQLVNVVLREMRKRWPAFGLEGSMTAQGDEVSDRWSLAIGPDGMAHKLPLASTGCVVTCPHCQECFSLEGPVA